MCLFQQEIFHCGCTLTGRLLHQCRHERQRLMNPTSRRAHPVPSSTCRPRYQRSRPRSEEPCFFCSLHDMQRSEASTSFAWSAQEWNETTESDLAEYRAWDAMMDDREALRKRIHDYVEQGQHRSAKRSDRRRIQLKRLCHAGMDLASFRRDVDVRLGELRDNVDAVGDDRVGVDGLPAPRPGGYNVGLDKRRRERIGDMEVLRRASGARRERSSEGTRTARLLGNLEIASLKTGTPEVLEDCV